MSDTPQTDAKEQETINCYKKTHAYYGWKHARKLERQRDALLEALKDLHDVFQFTDESPGQRDAILRARKAIEECK